MSNRIESLKAKIERSKAEKDIAGKEIKDIKKALKKSGIKNIDREISNLTLELNDLDRELEKELTNAENIIESNRKAE